MTWLCLLLILIISTDPVESKQIPTSSQAVHIVSDCNVVGITKILRINGCYRIINSFAVCGGSCYSTDGLDGIIAVKKDSSDGTTKVLSDTCQCCTPSSFKMESVKLRCGGLTWKKFNLVVPKSCSCKRCSEGEATKPTVKRSQRKRKKFF